VGVLREGRIAPASAGLGMPKRAADVGVDVTFALISDSIPCSTTSGHIKDSVALVRLSLDCLLRIAPRRAGLGVLSGRGFGWKLPRAEALGYFV
jgi:hypothetical protein